jgi:hypothetical protein
LRLRKRIEQGLIPDVHIKADTAAQRDFGFTPLAFEEGIKHELSKAH